MNHVGLLDPKDDPRLLAEGRPWVVWYEASMKPDPKVVVEAFEEFERLARVGVTPSLLISDRDRRVGLGRTGMSRWYDMVAPFWSNSIAYARMSARRTMFAWTVGKVGWNMTVDMPEGTTRPSLLESVDELHARMSITKSIITAAADAFEERRWRAVDAARSTIVTAAAAQMETDRPSAWHQDGRVLGGMDGVEWLSDEARPLSEQGVAALDALPSLLHMEHRRGLNAFKNKEVETVRISTPITLCGNPGNAMDRLRSLAVIPEGETWCST